MTKVGEDGHPMTEIVIDEYLLATGPVYISRYIHKKYGIICFGPVNQHPKLGSRVLVQFKERIVPCVVTRECMERDIEGLPSGQHARTIIAVRMPTRDDLNHQFVSTSEN